MGNAIEVRNLSKRYMIGGRPIGGLLTEAVADRLRGRRAPPDAELWALRDVSFSVAAGEVVGIIGRNGAGKSTLLKLLARITQPTTGSARMRGRVGALLEVGTGFHEELTGRENVFLSGAVLGMSRAQIRARFDDIVEFSGVGRFVDTPLKRYSSGMKLRLAFAVAAHLEPDVLVVDEVLAVGDAEFQRRCLGRMEDLHRTGRTIIFVSHDLGAIGRLCERTIWLDGGRVAFDGPTGEALRRYYAATSTSAAGRAEIETDPRLPVALTSVALTDPGGRLLPEPVRHDVLQLRICVQVRERVPGLDVGISLTDSLGLRVLEDTLRFADPESRLGAEPAHVEVAVELPALLRADDYRVGVYLYAGDDWYVVEEPLSFRVLPALGESDDGLRPAVRPMLTWSLEPMTATRR